MLKLGTAQVDITPPPNVPMCGYSARKRGSEGVHDPIFAKALVVREGGDHFGWVIADLIGVMADMTREVRTLASRLTGIPAKAIMVSTLHDHSGPDVRAQPKCDADHAMHKRYLEVLPKMLAGSLVAAAKSLEPVMVSYGRAALDTVQHNRRFHMTDGKVSMDWDRPDPAKVAWRGMVDPAVQVLAFRNKKGLRAVLAQFAMHSTVMDSGNLLITADWPGAARRHLARLVAPRGGRKAAPFISIAQGCCADVNPAFPRDTFREVEAKGRKVAEAAKRALERAQPLCGEEVKAAVVPVRLPGKKEGLDPRPTGKFWKGEVQGFRIGDVAIVGLPGEVFVGVGLDVKAHSDFRATFVGSYANDYKPGYIPTSAEYAWGNYEVETSAVALGADVMLTAAAMKALGKLCKA